MNRIIKTFKSINHPALVAFITAGDPDYGRSLEILRSMPDAGADLIELGMPFTDPVADGPTIQAASQRALESGANMHKTLGMVREFRKENDHTPIILMGYMNPVHHYGVKDFIEDASDAGIDGLIIVDMPPEEDEELRTLAEARNVAVIRLITPTTDEKRLETLLKTASGFLYYVSITGITGAAKAQPSDIEPHIQAIKEKTDLPIAIGFGISTPEEAQAMGEISNGVVVGSAFVKSIADSPNAKDLPEQIARKISALSTALKLKQASAA